MRAIRVHAYGAPPQVDDAPAPRPPEHGQIAIDVSAMGVGAWDAGVASGRLARFVRHQPPFIMGAELAGRVAEVGPGVDGFAVGDRVMCNPGIVGAWAERVTIDADRCGHAPVSVDDAGAAAIPVSGLTAWQALEPLALPQGASLLVLGAGGGVGRAAVQLARLRGTTVLTVVSADAIERSLELGASNAVAATADWVSETRRSAPAGVDAILDLVGGETLRRSIELIGDGGHIVTTRAEAATTTVPAGVTIDLVRMQSRTADLAALAALVDDDRLSMPVSRILPLDDVSIVLDDVGGQRRPGKLVMEP